MSRSSLRSDLPHFYQVLLNIGFIAADGDEGTLFPAGDIARNDADPFVFNPVSTIFFARLFHHQPSFNQNVSPLDDVATNDIRRLYVVTIIFFLMLVLTAFAAGTRRFRTGGA